MKTGLSVRLAAGLVVACAAWGFECAGSAALGVVISGGPTYDSSTGTGYQSPSLTFTPGSSAGDGTALGIAQRFDSGANKGARAVRWDASGAPATELGNLGTNASGFTFCYAYSINTGGAAVGLALKHTSGTQKGARAVRWDASGTTAIELGNLGTSSSGIAAGAAYSINTAGMATGYADKYVSGTNQGPRAVRWDASGAATELGNISTTSNGFAAAQAFVINAAGTAAGAATKFESSIDKGVRAVRWDGSGTAAAELGDLGTDVDGKTSCQPNSISADGTAVGFANKYSATVYKGIRAVRWDGSGTAATELDNLGTDASGSTVCQAYAVNAGGTAVGSAAKYESGSDKGTRAVRWDASGTAATELGNLGTSNSGVTSAQANAINAAGMIVGLAEKYDLTGTDLGQRAVAWRADGVAIELNSLLALNSGWENLSGAYGISDTGWITGIGTFDPGGGATPYQRMFLMQVPEPTAASLLPLVAGLIRLHRRRRW